MRSEVSRKSQSLIGAKSFTSSEIVAELAFGVDCQRLQLLLMLPGANHGLSSQFQEHDVGGDVFVDELDREATPRDIQLIQQCLYEARACSISSGLAMPSQLIVDPMGSSPFAVQVEKKLPFSFELGDLLHFPYQGSQHILKATDPVRLMAAMIPLRRASNVRVYHGDKRCSAVVTRRRSLVLQLHQKAALTKPKKNGSERKRASDTPTSGCRQSKRLKGEKVPVMTDESAPNKPSGSAYLNPITPKPSLLQEHIQSVRGKATSHQDMGNGEPAPKQAPEKPSKTAC
ncbi:hypothetical protein OPT61_g6565 [Boeremia exigua]|uniref:Uncharacterized protein n=1 Tax=Boeremia exigua TaxID=749465 RepID=A0ACC2I689_9PLEO|nr:hypothetical protein OPT61_g6565 [Boeremia exigua]